MKFKFVFGTVCLVASNLMLHAQSSRQVKQAFPLSGDDRWDYITVWKNDLFVSHGSIVHVLEKGNGKELGQITGLSGVHGIAIDPEHANGYISNGKENNVVVFDLNTLKVLSKIATGANPDFIMYDSFSRMVVVGNGKSNSVSVIDTKNMMVKSTIRIAGKPEAIVSDNAGRVYVNIEDKNEIAVIDLTKLKQESTINIAAFGDEPTGLAIDRLQHLAFVGCGNEQLLIVDLVKGKVIDHIRIGAGCDAVTYNASKHIIYASNGEDGTLSVIEESAPLHFKKIQDVKTILGAKTMALDESADRIYLPVAHLNGKKRVDGKPAFDPGSFKVLVVQ